MGENQSQLQTDIGYSQYNHLEWPEEKEATGVLNNRTGLQKKNIRAIK